jgi:hypothetical protein
MRRGRSATAASVGDTLATVVAAQSDTQVVATVPPLDAGGTAPSG